jgi:hypothetical protein
MGTEAQGYGKPRTEEASRPRKAGERFFYV